MTLDIESLCYHDRGPIDLVIEAGECVSLIGASGAGKTLLLRALADLDPHTGRVALDGVSSAQMTAPEWRQEVGMLPSESAWWSDIVSDHFPDNVLVSELRPYGFEEETLSWRVQRLSTGERQRLAVARLLARGPKALLLDEPTASLDPDNVVRMERLLSRYRTNHAAPVLWVTHDPEQAARVATRHFELVDGRLVKY